MCIFRLHFFRLILDAHKILINSAVKNPRWPRWEEKQTRQKWNKLNFKTAEGEAWNVGLRLVINIYKTIYGSANSESILEGPSLRLSSLLHLDCYFMLNPFAICQYQLQHIVHSTLHKFRCHSHIVCSSKALHSAYKPFPWLLLFHPNWPRCCFAEAHSIAEWRH